MINRLTHTLTACLCALALGVMGCASPSASTPALPRITPTTAPSASITTMRPAQGECGGAPCNPYCNEDEVQVTADQGVRICFHREGNGYRILP